LHQALLNRFIGTRDIAIRGSQFMATITFYGAAREVTGSCHLLESPACGRLLLDCGMHQGGDAVDRIEKDNFEFDPGSIDSLVLSHAHLDHSGLLPKLVHQGYCGPIYCTSATAELLEVMLDDSVGLYERDMRRGNNRRERRGQKLLKPEYVRADVKKVLQLCNTCGFDKTVSIAASARLRFLDAGHILGSSIVEITLAEDDREKILVFSGDLGKQGSVLMNDPARPKRADLVMMEGTYGDRDHRTLDSTIEQLGSILSDTWNRGGNIFIPSFAVGRAQELIFHLGCLHHDGLLDNWQIFLDSPMAIAVTKVYDNWLNLLDDEFTKELSKANRGSLVEFLPSLNLSISTEESMAINRIKYGAIVIAGSGMCTGGRIRQHLKQRIWNEKDTVVFVGFQARGTLGRIIVDGARRIKMFGEEFIVKAKIETLGGFSAHAGQSELLDWISGFETNPKIVLVHGETGALDALALKLQEEQGLSCEIPEQGESIHF
jgi:metallo-beta-lactamase family protein